jgi:hypothetical protein
MDGHEATGVWDRHSGDILGHQFGIMLNGFHLGTDSKLYVSSLDKSGNRVVRDLGLMLGFASSYTTKRREFGTDTAATYWVINSESC